MRMANQEISLLRCSIDLSFLGHPMEMKDSNMEIKVRKMRYKKANKIKLPLYYPWLKRRMARLL